METWIHGHLVWNGDVDMDWNIGLYKHGNQEYGTET